MIDKSQKSEISGRDLQIPFGEFKTVNSILLTKYCSHRTEISTKDIVTFVFDDNYIGPLRSWCSN